MSNATYAKRSLSHVWHPCTQMQSHEQHPPLPIQSGQGVWLQDYEGNHYLDAVSSWWVNLFGHNHPKISSALKAQIDRLEHVMLAGFTHEPVIRLSEKLSQLTGLGHAFYGSDGSSATEIALKMSAHYWQNIGKPEKNRFIGLEAGYHGETVGSLSVTDIALFRTAYEPLIRISATVPNADTRKCRLGQSHYELAIDAATKLEYWLANNHHNTAAFILEPLVQCAGGMAMYDAEYLRRARELCDRYDVHLIADEIAVGFGRTGTMFAHEQAQIKPDILCLSKGLTGGYLPLSVALCQHSIYSAFYHHHPSKGFLHSHSYTGNPLACTAALATLEIFESENILQNNQDLINNLQASFSATINLHPRVSNTRRCGLIWAWDISLPSHIQTYNFSQLFGQKSLLNKVILRPMGNVLYCMPPYVMNKSECEFLAHAINNTLNQTLDALGI